jgi:hypothetical protein
MPTGPVRADYEAAVRPLMTEPQNSNPPQAFGIRQV